MSNQPVKQLIRTVSKPFLRFPTKNIYKAFCNVLELPWNVDDAVVFYRQQMLCMNMAEMYMPSSKDEPAGKPFLRFSIGWFGTAFYRHTCSKSLQTITFQAIKQLV